jgi:hypothetical protein
VRLGVVNAPALGARQGRDELMRLLERERRAAGADSKARLQRRKAWC